MKDFPAAHSMDTEWFAVDADGNVGRFDSGEDGAVPNAAAIGLSPGDASFDTTLLRLWCFAPEIVANPPDLPPAEGGGRLVLVPEQGYRNTVVPEGFVPIGPLYLSNADVPAGDGRTIPHARTYDCDRLLETFEGEPPYGTFAFDRQHGDDPGLYQRIVEPEHALRVESLPEPLKQALSGLKLPVRFAEITQLHLADHLANQDVALWQPDGALRLEDVPPPRAAPRETSRGTWVFLLAVVLMVVAAVLLLASRR